MARKHRNVRWLALLAAATVVATASAASAARIGPGPGRLGDYFFGPKLARAEVVMVENGIVHDYRIDRGRIRMARPGVLVLKELDGQVERVPLSPSTEILLNGQPVPPDALGRGMIALAIRDGNSPAIRVIVTGSNRG